MSLCLLTPCPKCGLVLTFPGMPSIDYVIEGLMAETHGKCPECGEQVVVDQSPPAKPSRVDSFAVATTVDAIRAVLVVDLELSVRCRLAIVRSGANTVGDLLNLGRQTIHERFSEHPDYIAELEQLFAAHGISW